MSHLSARRQQVTRVCTYTYICTDWVLLYATYTRPQGCSQYVLVH